MSSRFSWVVLVAPVSLLGACEGGGSTSNAGDGGAGAVNTNEAGSGTAGDGGDACALPQASGTCEAAIPRFWFNASSDACEAFTYGGCGGNANNFETLDACRARCGGTSGPPQTGGDCAVMSCAQGSQCAYVGAGAVCGETCAGEGAPCKTSGQSCKCGGSCPMCKDCVRICAP